MTTPIAMPAIAPPERLLLPFELPADDELGEAVVADDELVAVLVEEVPVGVALVVDEALVGVVVVAVDVPGTHIDGSEPMPPGEPEPLFHQFRPLTRPKSAKPHCACTEVVNFQSSRSLLLMSNWRKPFTIGYCRM
jgi:hypothetical protein